MVNREVVVTDDFDSRFNRIENKLDAVAEAIVDLARMEERMISLFQRQDVYDKRQQVMGERIGSMFERVVELEKSSMSSRVVERIFYIIITAGVASLFWYMQQ